MKKIIENLLIKICVIAAALLIAFRVFVIVIGCLLIAFRSYEKKHKPDDMISEAIYEAVGDKKVRYCGKEYFKSGEIALYEYEIRDHEDEKLLTDMVQAANAVMKEEALKEKMVLAIREEFVSGAYRTSIWICNYYEDKDGYGQYEFLQDLSIRGTVFDSSSYNKAATYINLPDIKRLYVTEKVAKDAEENGIDWYEIWPDLEYFEVTEDRY